MNDKGLKTTTRRIGMLIHEKCDLIDACGPLDVFAFANLWFHLTGKCITDPYCVSLIAEKAGLVKTFSGMSIAADHVIGDIDDEIDTLLIAGGPYFEAGRINQTLIDWIKGMAKRVRRIGSICTGAFLLAESGILDGRRAATHWRYCQQLIEEFPNVAVEPDRIFVQDGNIYTSGGVTSGIDLALFLIEEDWGHEAATWTARSIVTFPCRPGGQTQYRSFLLSDNTTNRDFRKLQEWIISNPQADLSIEAIAERMCMSPRNFSRLFNQEIGIPPAKFVESARLMQAFQLLEQTSLSIDVVANRAGFGSTENMRRSFQRNLKISPQDYRMRFRSPGNALRVADA